MVERERTLEEVRFGSLISSWRATPQNESLSRRVNALDLPHKAEMCPQPPSKDGLMQPPSSSPLNPASPFRWKPSIRGPQTKQRDGGILLPAAVSPIADWEGVRGVHYNSFL